MWLVHSDDNSIGSDDRDPLKGSGLADNFFANVQTGGKESTQDRGALALGGLDARDPVTSVDHSVPVQNPFLLFLLVPRLVLVSPLLKMLSAPSLFFCSGAPLGPCILIKHPYIAS